MAPFTYIDFDLQIERVGAARQPVQDPSYRAQVINSPGGQATQLFKLPFQPVELKTYLQRFGRTREIIRQNDSPEPEQVVSAKTFGGRLFTAVFDNDVRDCLRGSLDEASRQGARLRIRLRLNGVPELANLPWEYLYNGSVNRFLALSDRTPVVRYLDLPERIRPLTVAPPLRALVMISSPADLQPLDVEQEWAKLKQALNDLEQRQLLTLERLDAASLPALQRQLQRNDYHILHFIGHGSFDAATQDGALALEGADGRAQQISGQYLGTLLYDHDPLRLVVLNACEGARTANTDPFAGMAQSLVQQGMPAVVAMQFAITDDAAITFAQGFYSAIANNYPVDAAVSQARKSMFVQGNELEWATPVLFLRAPDGVLFTVQGVEPVRVEQLPAKAPAPPATPATFGALSSNINISGNAAVVGPVVGVNSGSITMQTPSNAASFVSQSLPASQPQTITDTYDVFISYSHQEQDWVRAQLLPRLEQSGLRVCIDDRDFEIGVPGLINMERAVEQSRRTLLVLTPNWIAGEWTDFEALLTQTGDPVGRRRKLIPLLLEPCQLPQRLAMLTYIDFTNPADRPAQMERLIHALR